MLTRRVKAKYWARFFAFSAGMLAYLHISPWAVEPPQDVRVPYDNPVWLSCVRDRARTHCIGRHRICVRGSSVIPR